MHLSWYGQAAFRIVDDAGRRIVCDPYDPELLGFPPIDEPCDLVVTSSANDQAHCRHDLVPGEHAWVNALDVAREGGARTVDGLGIRAIESMEAEDHPTHDPEQNAMYRFVVDGLHVAHMGDIGNPLTERQTRFLDGVDVLLALAGGPPVVPLDELVRVIGATAPRLVVPMHHRTPLLVPPGLLEIEHFLALVDPDTVDRADASSATITRDTLPGHTRVLVLEQKV